MAGKLGRNFLHNSVGISTWGIVTCIMGLSDASVDVQPSEPIHIEEFDKGVLSHRHSRLLLMIWMSNSPGSESSFPYARKHRLDPPCQQTVDDETPV